MNKVCHYMEDHLAEIKRLRRKHTSEDVLNLMYSGNNQNFCDEDVALMNEFYLAYKKAKEKFKKSQRNDFDDSNSATNTFNTKVKDIREQISEKIFSSVEYQCDLAIYISYELHPSRTKDFCWELFGNQIIKNIECNSSTPALLPVPAKDGDIEYLGKRYKTMEVNL